MSRYRLTGNYGTFEITRIVELDSHDEAYALTGIVADLVAVGWHFTEAPEGEEWEIEVFNEQRGEWEPSDGDDH